MECVVCRSNDWENVDKYRHDEKNMCMCKKCGFVSYPTLYKTKQEIIDYYRKEYRPPPSAQNYFTGYRKLGFHLAFLGDSIKKHLEGKKAPVIGEVGAAFGMFLDYFRSQYAPDGVFHGTELTTSFKRVAHWEFGLDLTDELPPGDYDVISSYKVAEHQLDVDLELANYRKYLEKKDGLLYISVPTWFDILNNFGKGGFDLNYYYDTNHVNVWTKKLFESCLKKAGFEIIKHDGFIYDDTYLCKVCEPKALTEADYEDPKDILDRLDRIKKASDFAAQGKHREALEMWPRFPIVWSELYNYSRSKLHATGESNPFEHIMKEVTEPMFKVLGKERDTLIMAADLCMAYEKWDRAIDYLSDILEICPVSSVALDRMSQCFRQKALVEKDEIKRVEHFARSRHLVGMVAQNDPQRHHDQITWRYHDESQMPVRIKQTDAKTMEVSSVN